jgi:hypothetical protein
VTGYDALGGETDALVPRENVLFDAGGAAANARREPGHARKKSLTEMPRAAAAVRERDEEDMWAELG